LSLSSDQSFGKYQLGKTLVGNAMNSGSADSSQQGTTKATIGGAVINVTDQAAQSALTGKDGAAVIAGLNRDLTNGNDVVAKQDLQKLQTEASIKQQFANALTSEAFEQSDQAYKVLFQDHGVYYKVTCGGSKDQCLKGQNISLVEITPEQAVADGAILAVNGINNDKQRAGELAYQNAPVDKGGNKPDSLVLMHIDKTPDGIADVLVASYEKLLAPVFGYSNADNEYAKLLEGRGTNVTLSLGHSRGTIVQYNALNIAKDANYVNPNLSVMGFGGGVLASSYYNAAKAVNNNDFSPSSQNNVDYTFMKNDPVAVIAGLNGLFGDGNMGSALVEFKNVYAKSNSAHSCYGTGAKDCVTISNPISTGPEPLLNSATNPANVIWYHNGSKKTPGTN
jgi:filamentous hemagglutinin